MEKSMENKNHVIEKRDNTDLYRHISTIFTFFGSSENCVISCCGLALKQESE